MIIVSWNTRGLKDVNKRLAIKRFLRTHKPELVLIQESKKEEFDLHFTKSLWSSKDIGGDFVKSCGTSDGMLIMWDTSKITDTKTLKGRYSSTVKCITLCRKTCWKSNVYGQNNYREKKSLWPELLILLKFCLEAWCVGSDFNITRWAHESFPLGRTTRGYSGCRKRF